MKKTFTLRSLWLWLMLMVVGGVNAEPIEGVAKIGDNYYATLVDAIKAVNLGTETSPAIIKMIADDDMLETIAIVDGKDITIDLNGKTVKNDASKTLAQLITVNGKLTIDDSSAEKNGVIKNTASGKYVIKPAKVDAVLTLKNGTIQTTAGNSGGAVYCTNGSFVMTGGEVSAAGTGVYSKNVNISGGEITAAGGPAVSGAGVISGGTITSTGKYSVYAGQGATLEITGGTFSSAAGQPTVKVYTVDVKVAAGVDLPNGIDFTNNATGLILAGGAAESYTAKAHAAIYDGETLVGYAPINTGILASTKVSDKVVKLIKDVATTTYLNITKSFTLDLNGHNITCTPTKADATLYLKGSASSPVNVTIVGNGKISCEDHGEGCNAIQMNICSTVNIEGGEYYVPGDNSTIYIAKTNVDYPTVVNISGGKFSSDDGKYVLNIKDDERAGAQFNVSGGTFVGFDPQNNIAEGTNTSFVTDGYMSVDNGDGTFGAAIVEVTMGYQSCSDKYNGGTPVKFDVNSGFDIVDDGNVQSVSIPADIDGAAVTYKRNLKTAYQSWYVPFDYTLTTEDVEKMRFLDIFNLDVDEQTGKAKNIVGRVMTAGETVKANKPYMVRATVDAGEYTFEATGLKKTEEKAVWCETTSLRYTFGGIYNAVSLSANPFYALSSNGVFEYWDEPDIVQNAFGFVMVIMDKNNGFAPINPHVSTTNLARKINLRIIGDDDDEEVTGISSVQSAEAVAGGKIYDIAGRQLNSMSKAGLYIVNGKKIYRK